MGNCFLYKRGFGGFGGGGEITPEVEKTASGKVISILNSTENPLKGLRLFGKTTQNGTPSPTAPVPMVNVGDGGSIAVKIGTSESDANAQTLTVSTPNGLPGVHVSDGGKYTDENGWQWICDEVDFGRGKYVQNVYYHTFNGTESDIRCVSGTNWYIAKPLATLAYGRGAIISSHYPADARTNVENTGYLNSSGLAVFNDKSFTNADAVKTHLAANPVTVCYPLAAPIETDLTPEQLSAYAALHTLSPSTTIYNDADSYMEVKYMAKGG